MSISPRLEAGQAYDRVAGVYDGAYADNRCRAEDEVVTDYLRRVNAFSGRVLDVGCGTGALVGMACLSSFAYLGIDPSHGMLAQAVRKWPHHRFQVGYAEAPGAVGSFDSVVSIYGSFNYCTAPQTAVDELANVLRPGGRLAVMVYADRHRFSESYIMRKVGMEVEHRRWRAGDLARLFSRRFDVLAIQGFGWKADRLPDFAPVPVFRRVLETEMVTVGRWSPDRCSYLILTARRPG